MSVSHFAAARAKCSPRCRATLGILAPDEHVELDAERELGREGVVHDGVDHSSRMMNERSRATVLVRLGALLREQRSNAVGELGTKRCLEPTTILL